MPAMVRLGAGFLSFSATTRRSGTGSGQVVVVWAKLSAGSTSAAQNTPDVNRMQRCSITPPRKADAILLDSATMSKLTNSFIAVGLLMLGVLGSGLAAQGRQGGGGGGPADP